MTDCCRQWTFTDIGSRKYPINGFQLICVNSEKQIERMDLEFNSIAWGEDIGSVQCTWRNGTEVR